MLLWVVISIPRANVSGSKGAKISQETRQEVQRFKAVALALVRDLSSLVLLL